MSELQIALLVIAGAVLAGLYVAGKWQERRLLRRLSEEFGGDVGDALLGGAQAPEPGSLRSPAAPAQRGGRIEPRLQSSDSPVPAPQTEQELTADTDEIDGVENHSAAVRRSDWVEDPMLDCVLELRCTRPVDGVSFIDAAMPLTSTQWPMQVAFVVWDARAQQWVLPDRFGYYTDALAAIQLASRRQVLDQDQIGRFVSAVRQAAAMLEADCDPPDVARLAEGAAELDRLCARFDVRIGLNLRARAGPWTQARVEAAAAELGLVPEGELRWAHPDPDKLAPLVLSMPAAVSERACLELDVPRTASGSTVVQAMFSLANQLGAQLGAGIVDDNGRPIDAQSVGAIESQLAKLFADMKSAGIDPGGERARRLYA